MPDDTRSPSQIERDIERERSELSQTLEELQDRFSFDGIVRELRDQFNQYGGEISGAMARQARENPLALAVTGIGLAWLIFGNERAPRSRIEYRDTHRFSEPREGVAQNRNPSRMPGTRPDDAYVSERYRRYSQSRAHKNSPDWARPTPTGYYTSADNEHLDGHDTSPSMGERASDMAAKAGEKMSEASTRAKQMGQAVLSRAEQMGKNMSDSVRHTRERGRSLRYQIGAGTEHLSEEARARVIAARNRAIDAQEEVSRTLSHSRDSIADFLEEHPLAVGALALAVGAAIGGALPRTRTEDEYLGVYRDELMDEAERIFREETEKARKVADAAMQEAQDIAQEKGDEVVQSATDQAKDAASRVGEAAKQEAENQNLGTPKA